MITNEEKEDWHYLAVKKLLTLLRGITSKHHSDFFHYFPTKNKLESHEKTCKKKDFCRITLPT